MRTRAALAVVALVLAALVVWGQMPAGIRLFQVIQNAAHAPVFFVITLIVLKLLRGRYALTFAVCLLLGIAIEGLQALIGRDAELADVITDAAGIVTALAYASRKSRPAMGWAVFSAGVVISLAPVIWSAAGYIDRNLRFPVLAQSSSPVLLPQSEYPGVALEEVFPDWSGYRTLAIKLTSKEAQPLPLTIRVHDRDHTQEVDDRYSRHFVLPPRTAYILRIPLSEIEVAPRRRRMDMTRIAGIIIFTTPENAGRSFYLDEVRLDNNRS